MLALLFLASALCVAAPAFAAGETSYPEALFYEKMRYLGYAQEIHARNLSNSDTPAYKAQGLAPFPEAVPEAAVSMTLTSPMHIASPAVPPYRAEEKPTRGEVKPNGNTVFPEDQLAEVNREELEHRTMIETARKFTSLRRAAWGDAR